MVSLQQGEAQWFAVAALLEVPEPAADVGSIASAQWRQCLNACKNPLTINAVLRHAFPEPCDLGREALCDLTAAILSKSLDPRLPLPSALAILRPLLAGALRSTPGLLLFAAEYLRLQEERHRASGGPHLEHVALQGRHLELLLWLIQAAPAPAAGALARTLAEAPSSTSTEASLLDRLLQGPVASPAAPLHVRLKAAQLVGLCCEASPAALRRCWRGLEAVLLRENNMEMLQAAAAGLFGGIGRHALALPAPEQAAAVDALEKGLACGVPAIQLPAALAAGRLLSEPAAPLPGWAAEVQRLAGSVQRALRAQEGRMGAWAAEVGPPAGGGEVLAGAFAPCHVLQVLRGCTEVMLH